MIVFYITCLKGSITAKGDLSKEYFGYYRILCRFGMDVVEVCRSGGYGIMVLHSLIYNSA